MVSVRGKAQEHGKNALPVVSPVLGASRSREHKMHEAGKSRESMLAGSWKRTVVRG